jgi:glycosyltransferase involved in cell wall biosynthesis
MLHKSESSLNRNIAKKVVVNSGFMRQYAATSINPEKICLIRNGVALNEVRSAARRTLDGEVNLLYVGRLNPLKGLDLLLEAFAKIKKTTTKDVRLYVAGSGSFESDYRQMASELHIDKWVTFLGRVPINECYTLFRSCSIFVSPSRFDSAPMAVLEGMAAGAPIVATNAGGTPEIAKNMRNCLLVKKTSEELAEKISYLIARPDECERLSANNLEDAEKYSWQNIASEHTKLYSSLFE